MPQPNTGPAPALVLFDIDGTLVRRAGPHHREALIEAVRRIAGVQTTTDHIPVQGMLDGDILAWMLKDAGVPAPRIREWMPKLTRRAQWIYSRRCPTDLTGKVCPGVVGLLQTLRLRRLLTGIVSGNLTQIGWKKIERAGLKQFFRYGCFADRGRTRSELVKLAIAEARANAWIARRTPIALIGDHPNDIEAARRNNVRSIAVATGVVGKDELAAHKPDLLLDDLRNLPMEFITA
ncbi:MAG: HAD hydrolase-like protein [Bryobacterales bacterium]|nr:HAD hydrolase-like protein [Bryobacterales bacterium]